MTNLAHSRARTQRALADLETAATTLTLAPVAEALRREATRLGSSRFVLALVGERLTGKSTLVNALLGNPVLPARPVPTTALLHEVEHAEAPQVVVRQGDEERVLTLAELAGLVEGAEVGDRSARVHVGFPAKILEGGVVLLDTPGTNDLSQLGAEVTYGILPDADAVVVVLDATQPLRRTEVDFLRYRLPRAARDRAVFVLNKADLLGVKELEEARVYTEEHLARLVPEAPLFVASAQRALERRDEDFDELRAHLTDLVGTHRPRLVLLRALGEATRLAEALRDHVQLRREAARLESEELESRLERLRGAIGGSRQAAHEACARVDARAEEIAGAARARLEEFIDRFQAALPAEIERAEEEDLRRYLPFFLEDTLRAFAEAEAARIEEALAALAHEALADFARKGKDAAAELDVSPQAALRVEVDTAKYDVGVFAAGALGTMFLFRMPLVGLLLLAAAPVIRHVLKGRVAGRVREVAREQAVTAVREAGERLREKLGEAVYSGANRIKEAVLAHGEESARGLELALEQSLARQRGEAAAPIPEEVEASIEGAAVELEKLGRELTGT